MVATERDRSCPTRECESGHRREGLACLQHNKTGEIVNVVFLKIVRSEDSGRPFINAIDARVATVRRFLEKLTVWTIGPLSI